MVTKQVARSAFVALSVGALIVAISSCGTSPQGQPDALSCEQVVANLTRADLNHTLSLGTARPVGCIDSTGTGVTGFTFETLNINPGDGCGVNTPSAGYAVVRWSDGTTSEMFITTGTTANGDPGLRFLPYNGHFTGYEANASGHVVGNGCTATALEGLFAADPLVFRPS